MNNLSNVNVENVAISGLSALTPDLNFQSPIDMLKRGIQ
jgi:hypothetical protein